MLKRLAPLEFQIFSLELILYAKMNKQVNVLSLENFSFLINDNIIIHQQLF